MFVANHCYHLIDAKFVSIAIAKHTVIVCEAATISLRAETVSANQMRMILTKSNFSFQKLFFPLTFFPSFFIETLTFLYRND